MQSSLAVCLSWLCYGALWWRLFCKCILTGHHERIPLLDAAVLFVLDIPIAHLCSAWRIWNFPVDCEVSWQSLLPDDGAF